MTLIPLLFTFGAVIIRGREIKSKRFYFTWLNSHKVNLIRVNLTSKFNFSTAETFMPFFLQKVSNYFMPCFLFPQLKLSRPVFLSKVQIYFMPCFLFPRLKLSRRVFLQKVLNYFMPCETFIRVKLSCPVFLPNYFMPCENFIRLKFSCRVFSLRNMRGFCSIHMKSSCLFGGMGDFQRSIKLHAVL